MKIADKLRDLNIQATRERSHFYVGSLAIEAADILDEMELLLDYMVKLGDEMAEHPMPNTYKLLAKVRGEGNGDG